MEIIKIKLHSAVDLITNSSTVIFTYQNSVNTAKDIVNEMLKLSGITDKTADDIFYYGVFCENYQYLKSEYCSKDCPTINAKRGTSEYKEQESIQNKWLSDLQLSIMKGEIEQPDWMNNAESGDYDDCNPSTYLTIIPKDEKYTEFGNKIKALLNSVDADGRYD